MSIPSTPRYPWHYWRTDDAHLREVSLAQGHRLALPAHCHEEDQLAFVLTGCRHFILPNHCVFLSAGQALRIPAGVVHYSRDIGLETRCVNLYLTPGYSVDPADCAALLSEIVNDTPHHILSVPRASPSHDARSLLAAFPARIWDLSSRVPTTWPP
ncbi:MULTISPECIES: cupin domain-containing protein [unclassified Saccharibacter]|uniref:cupin domain-containing protein n=1 Tax=unclassified Saccharibacter TaxID=2648722 RepID=UPI0013244E2A|nr:MULTISPECIES: hypothetical protein [unclassified Saccharibacter]MXV36867.1 hypothetical protein [Saccharibacter sp. EH611]MXV58643.1 hypothetical protein [Saccharibacter sp. EH70]MXV66149.1 hypothetical protein [Saccharibacter sp. EH60]